MDTEKRKEQKRLAAKRYRETHPEIVKQRNKEQYERKKLERSEKQKLYYQKNKQEILAKQKMHYQLNKESYAKKARQFRMDNKEVVSKRERKYDLWSKYKMTTEQLDELWSKQNGLCANLKCSDVLTTGKSGYCIDHCHTTGKVRGLLCRGCNLALGHVKDSVAKLVGLSEYILEAQAHGS